MQIRAQFRLFQVKAMFKQHVTLMIWTWILRLQTASRNEFPCKNTRFVSFDIVFTRLSFEKACLIPRQASRCQQAFSVPCLVNLISKDTHLVFYIYQIRHDRFSGYQLLLVKNPSLLKFYCAKWKTLKYIICDHVRKFVMLSVIFWTKCLYTWLGIVRQIVGVPNGYKLCSSCCRFVFVLLWERL